MPTLRPYSGNPAYWQYNDRPCVLFGGSFQDNAWQWAGVDKEALLKHLDILAKSGGNYIRCTISSRRHAFPTYCDDGMAYPFARQTDGLYDLNAWNEDYFERLDVFLAACAERAIIPQADVWDTYAVIGGRGSWDNQPWNPENNINYGQDDTVLRDGRKKFFTILAAHDPILGELQRAYMRRVIETCLAHDNVLYQLDNESPWPHQYSDYWARFIHACAAEKGKSVFVCDSRRYHPESYALKEFRVWEHAENAHPIQNKEIYNFCDIAQNGGNVSDTHYENLLWYRQKVAEHGVRPVNHVKTYGFIWPTGEDWGWAKTSGYQYEDGETQRRSAWRFWRSIFGGAASVRFHRDNCEQAATGFVTDQGVNGAMGLSRLAQKHIRSMAMLLERISIVDMAPCPDLIVGQRTENEAFVLAQPGRQYAVYFTGDRCDNKIELDLDQGTYDLEWLDILNASWTGAATIESDGTCTLQAPSQDTQWAAVLTRKEEDK